jgi:hypothetical protein
MKKKLKSILIFMVWFLIIFKPVIISIGTNNWWCMLFYLISFIYIPIGILLTEYIKDEFE